MTGGADPVSQPPPTRTTRPRLRGELWHAAAGCAVVALVAAAYVGWLHVSNPTVASLSFLLVVLLVSATSSLRVAVAVSVLAVLALNYFFMPPVGTFHLEDPLNGLAIVVFLTVSVVGSRLSVVARDRAALLEERHEAERMRQSVELKSALLSSLGHDLKTPLTAITVACENLQSSWTDEPQRREQLGIVLAEVSRLNHLFQNIVEMARIETRAVDAEREWVSPADIVEAAVAQVQTAVHDRPIDVASDAAVEVHLDPRLTTAALAHVLENAGQYTAPGSAIDVTAHVGAEGLSLTVRDRGTGIDLADEAHLFDRAYRGADARRQPFGTGMGLAISRGLLEAQGGRIAAANHPEGGAVFTLTIPAAARQVAPPPAGDL
jgi:two-component system sensor histidine kinase KdpD